MFSLGKPSKNKFASQLLEAIRRTDGEQQYIYDAGEFRLIRQDEEGEVNLRNIYREHCSLPKDERPGHLQRVASMIAGPEKLPDDFEEAKLHLRPKIWCRSTFAFLELQRQLKGGDQLDLPLYPLGSHLYSSIVYDTEEAMRTLSSKDLEKWGVTYYEAMEIACFNLEEATTAFAKIGDHFHSSRTGDSYESSRILLTDRIRSFEVVGDHIAVVPQRDTLLVAGSEDEGSLSILFELTAKTTEDPRPLSPLPLRLADDGEWVDWEPPKNHALREQFESLELHFLGGLYTEQQQLLNRLFEQNDDAPFVASFSALKVEETGKVQSYCVWTEGVDSFLPRTQLVMLGREGEILASGEWEHVASAVGDLLVADESYYPIRYRVREFPSEAQLAEIGNLMS